MPGFCSILKEHYSILSAIKCGIPGKKQKQIQTYIQLQIRKINIGKSDLDEKLPDLCLFHTTWCRYEFLHMPFGTRSASEMIWQKNEKAWIYDRHTYKPRWHDISSLDSTHDEIVKKALSNDQENSRLSPDEILFEVKEAKFMKDSLSNWIKLDHAKKWSCREHETS